MGDGKRAAEFIISKLKNTEGQNSGTKSEKLSAREFQKKLGRRTYGIALPETKLNQRNGFDLVNPVMIEREAVEEADRCLYCNDVCNICVSVCPNFANIGFTAAPVNIPVYTIIKTKNEIRAEITHRFNITQKNQILTIADFCNECGNCNTFCPTSGAPYKTKPLFFLTEESFNRETKGYFYNNGILQYRNNSSREKLTMNKEYFLYDSDKVSAKLNRIDFTISEVQLKNDSEQEIKLNRLAEMCFLIENLGKIAVFGSKE
jgi:putative selenate reductase